MFVFLKHGRAVLSSSGLYCCKEQLGFILGQGLCNLKVGLHNAPDNRIVLPLPNLSKGSTRWDKTANQFRQMQAYQAVIHEIKDPSDTVRTITLRVDEPGITFSAGQWIDFFIPNVETVAGFSMTSAPYLAEDFGLLDLAVKFSSYPPTHWIHHKCHLGDCVTIRVGGEFFYDPKPKTKCSTADLLLIGGGVGINPMASIAQHYAHILNNIQIEKYQEVNPGRLKLLYSAKNMNELVLRGLFEDLEKEHQSISCTFFVSKETSDTVPANTLRERISKEHLRLAMQDFSRSNTLCYICGPISMIDTMEQLLLEMGIEKENIKYEKWL